MAFPGRQHYGRRRSKLGWRYSALNNIAVPCKQELLATIKPLQTKGVPPLANDNILICLIAQNRRDAARPRRGEGSTQAAVRIEIGRARA